MGVSARPSSPSTRPKYCSCCSLLFSVCCSLVVVIVCCCFVVLIPCLLFKQTQDATLDEAKDRCIELIVPPTDPNNMRYPPCSQRVSRFPCSQSFVPVCCSGFPAFRFVVCLRISRIPVSGFRFPVCVFHVFRFVVVPGTDAVSPPCS